ncbi:MAG: oligosaccharide flippase family protein [Candidatus Promineifilaceae bacterium]|nr:oligosaccharide flippase family protein [Candidatus Promineifilaceae bacterium]
MAEESKRIAKGGTVVLTGTIVAQALSMVTTLWIARRLGPDDFGLLTLATSLLLPLAALATLGLSGSLVRFIPVYIGKQDKTKVAGVISSAFVMGGIASVFVAAVTFVFSDLIAGTIFSDLRLGPMLKALALTIPLIVLTNIASAATRGSKKMHFDAIVQVVGPVVMLLVWGIGLLLFTNSLGVAIYATLIRWLIMAFLSLGFVVIVFGKFFGKGIDWAFRSLWVYSAPLIVSSLMYTLSPRMDRLVLGVVGDTFAVGVYSLAASVVMILKLLHASIVKTFLPVVADAYNRVSINRAKMLYTAVTRWDARLTFLSVVISMLIAQEVLGLLGESYAAAILPFVILAAAVYIGTIPGPTGAFLQMTNHQRVEAANAAIFFVVSPIIQWVLALWLGWIGVAIGVLVTAIIINLAQIAEIYFLYDFHPFHSGHFLFTALSVGTVIVCAVVGLTQPLSVRLLLLVLIICGFMLFVYRFRTGSDELILKMIAQSMPFAKMENTPS